MHRGTLFNVQQQGTQHYCVELMLPTGLSSDVLAPISPGPLDVIKSHAHLRKKSSRALSCVVQLHQASERMLHQSEAGRLYFRFRLLASLKRNMLARACAGKDGTKPLPTAE